VTALERLIENLAKLPGLGRKSASRIAYHLMKAEDALVQGLARDISQLKEKVRNCPVCGGYTEEIPCRICTDSQRDRATLCVVEEPKDLLSIELTRQYHGLYHVLMGVISPIDGIGPEDLLIASLLRRVREGEIKEVIIATNPTVEGEATAAYLARLLKPLGLRVTRIAMGIPVGSDLEFADEVTMTKSLENRREL